MLISSLDNKMVKEIRHLKDKSYSLEKGLYLIEGDHLVREAIKEGVLQKLYLLEGNNGVYDFEYDTLTEKVMKSISDMKSVPRVIGLCKINNSKEIGNKIVLLDGIQDPGNAGTIIRTCTAFGIDTIIFSNDSVSPYNIKTVRSAQGMIFKTNIVVSDLKSIISKIKEKDIKLIGTSLHTNKYIDDMEKFEKYAVVFGNEGNGVSEEILSLCDEIYKIKMSDICESLNVGVSSGIILEKLF